MANKNIHGRMMQKCDTSANWGLASNFVPLPGEIIVYSDFNKIKIGDGATTVGSLPFITDLPAQNGQNGKFLTTNGTAPSWATVNALPAQASHSGQFLTTNGTTASWATVDALPAQSGHNGQFLSTNGISASWENVELLPAVTASNNGEVLAVVNGNWTNANLQDLIGAWDGGNF